MSQSTIDTFGFLRFKEKVEINSRLKELFSISRRLSSADFFINYIFNVMLSAIQNGY